MDENSSPSQIAAATLMSARAEGPIGATPLLVVHPRTVEGAERAGGTPQRPRLSCALMGSGGVEASIDGIRV